MTAPLSLAEDGYLFVVGEQHFALELFPWRLSDVLQSDGLAMFRIDDVVSSAIETDSVELGDELHAGINARLKEASLRIVQATRHSGPAA